MARFYKIAVVLLLGFYAAVLLTGWELSGSERQEVPASVRNSPGGPRSYHFWFSGFHGGK